MDNAHLGYVIEHALINKQTQVAQGFLYRLASQIQLGFYIRVCPGGGAPQSALAGDRRFLLGRQQAQIRRFDPRFQHTGGNQDLTAQFQHVALTNALDEHMVPYLQGAG